MLNADVLIDMDLQALWHWHCQRQALVTMVLRPDPAARSYGAVLVDADDRVRLINGRPSTHVPATGQEMMFACVQVVDPQVLERIPPDCFSMTTSDVFPALIERNEQCMATATLATGWTSAHQSAISRRIGTC